MPWHLVARPFTEVVAQGIAQNKCPEESFCRMFRVRKCVENQQERGHELRRTADLAHQSGIALPMAWSMGGNLSGNGITERLLLVVLTVLDAGRKVVAAVRAAFATGGEEGCGGGETRGGGDEDDAARCCPWPISGEMGSKNKVRST